MGPFTAVGERRSLVTDLSKEKGPKSSLSLSCLQSEVVFHDSSSIVPFLNRRDPDVGFPSAKELSRSVKFFSTLSYLPTISLRGKQRQGRSNRFHIQAPGLQPKALLSLAPPPLLMYSWQHHVKQRGMCHFLSTYWKFHLFGFPFLLNIVFSHSMYVNSQLLSKTGRNV